MAGYRYPYKPSGFPSVDWKNPIAQGLRMYLIFNEGGGSNVRDLTRNCPNLALTANASWIQKPDGLTTRTATETQLGTIAAHARWQPTAAITIMMRASVTLSGSNHYWFTSEGSTPTGWGIYNIGTGTWHPYMRVGSAWQDYGGFPTYVSDSVVTITQTYNGATHKAYSDKTLISSNAATGAIPYDASKALSFHSSDASSNLTSAVDYVFAIWDRALTAAEINEMIDYPYGLIMTRRVSSNVPNAVTNITASDSATLSDSSSLTAAFVPTDTETLTDSSSLAAAIGASDSGSTSEGSTVGLAAVDSAALSDTSAETAVLVPSDALTLSDSSSETADYAVTDAETLTDVSSEAAAYAVSDTFTLTEASALAADIAAADTFTLSDSSSVSTDTAKSGSDTGALDDQSGLVVNLNVSDSFALSDSSGLGQSFSVTDTLTLTDGSGLAAALTAVDTFALFDVSVLGKALVVTDTFTLAEFSAVNNGLDTSGFPVFDTRALPILFDTRLLPPTYDNRSLETVPDERTLILAHDTRSLPVLFDNGR